MWRLLTYALVGAIVWVEVLLTFENFFTPHRRTMRQFLLLVFAAAIIPAEMIHTIQSCNDLAVEPAGSDTLRLSSYSPCSKTCGTGQRWAATLVIYYDSTSGDILEQCQEELAFEPCNTRTCPSSPDGGWSPWCPWKSDPMWPCSTCGGPGVDVMFRRRWCDSPAPSPGGQACKGRKRQTRSRPCSLNPCPVNGQWGEWTVLDSDDCSVTCGGGVQTQTRNRTCDDPGPLNGGSDCEGDSQVTGRFPCNSQPCPDDSQWGDWTIADTGSCSVTCGCGERTRKRSRSCEVTSPGGVCEGDRESTEIVPCFNPPCTVSATWNSCSWAVFGSMLAALAGLLLLLCCLVIYVRCCKPKNKVNDTTRPSTPQRQPEPRSPEIQMITHAHARPNVLAPGASGTSAGGINRRTRPELEQPPPWIY